MLFRNTRSLLGKKYAFVIMPVLRFCMRRVAFILTMDVEVIKPFDDIIAEVLSWGVNVMLR